MRVNQQKAVVLLNRPYSETSWLVEVFTRDYGRLALMAKGARRFKSRLKGVLLPFQPLLISWTGKGEIPILTSAEIEIDHFDIINHELTGDRAVCGFYCNELLVNLLHRYDPHRTLFERYIETVISLSKCESEQLANVLREFEKTIIKESGYEVNFRFQADGKSVIKEGDFYRFQQGEGFIPCPPNHVNAIEGRVICSVASHSHEKSLSMDDISRGKHLMRDILNQTLGYKKIVSRELFFPRQRSTNESITKES